MANRRHRPPSLDISSTTSNRPPGARTNPHQLREAEGEEDDDDKTPEYPLRYDHPLAQLNRRRLEEALLSGGRKQSHHHPLSTFTPNLLPSSSQISNNDETEVSNSIQLRQKNNVINRTSYPRPGDGDVKTDSPYGSTKNVTSGECIPSLVTASFKDSSICGSDTIARCSSSHPTVSGIGGLGQHRSVQAAWIPGMGPKPYHVDVSVASDLSISCKSQTLVTKPDERGYNRLVLSTSSENDLLSFFHMDSNNNADGKSFVHTNPVKTVTISESNDELLDDQLDDNGNNDEDDGDRPLLIVTDRENGYDIDDVDDDDDANNKSPPHLVPMDEDFSCFDSVLGSPDQPLPPKLSPVSSHCSIRANQRDESPPGKTSHQADHRIKSSPKTTSDLAEYHTKSPLDQTSDLADEHTRSPPRKMPTLGDHHTNTPPTKTSHAGKHDSQSSSNKSTDLGDHDSNSPPKNTYHFADHHTESLPKKTSDLENPRSKSPPKKTSHQGDHHTDSPPKMVPDMVDHRNKWTPKKTSSLGSHDTKSSTIKTSQPCSNGTESPPKKAPDMGCHRNESQPKKAPDMDSHGTESPPKRANDVGGHDTKSPLAKASQPGSHSTESQSKKASDMGCHRNELQQKKSSDIDGHGTKSPPVKTSQPSSHGTESPPKKASDMDNHRIESPQNKSHQTDYSTGSPQKKTSHVDNHGTESSSRMASYLDDRHNKSPPKETPHQGDHHMESPSNKTSQVGNHGTESPPKATSNLGSHHTNSQPKKTSHEGNHGIESPPKETSHQGDHRTKSQQEKKSILGNHDIELPPKGMPKTGSQHTESLPKKTSYAGIHRTQSPPKKASHRAHVHANSLPKWYDTNNHGAESLPKKTSHLGSYDNESAPKKTPYPGSHDTELLHDKTSKLGNLRTESIPKKMSHHNETETNKTSNLGDFNTNLQPKRTCDGASHRTGSPPNKTYYPGNNVTESTQNNTANLGNHCTQLPKKLSHCNEAPSKKTSFLDKHVTDSPPKKTSHHAHHCTGSLLKNTFNLGSHNIGSAFENRSSRGLEAPNEGEKWHQSEIPISSPQSNGKILNTPDSIDDVLKEPYVGGKTGTKNLRTPSFSSALVKTKDDKQQRGTFKPNTCFKWRYSPIARLPVSVCNQNASDYASKYLSLKKHKMKSEFRQKVSKFRRMSKPNIVSDDLDGSLKIKIPSNSSMGSWSEISFSTNGSCLNDSLESIEMPRMSPSVATCSSSEDIVIVSSCKIPDKTQTQIVSCSTLQDRIDVSSQNNVMNETKLANISHPERFMCLNISDSKTFSRCNTPVATQKSCVKPNLQCAASTIGSTTDLAKLPSSPMRDTDKAPLLAEPSLLSWQPITTASFTSHRLHSTTACSSESLSSTCKLNSTTSNTGFDIAYVQVSHKDLAVCTDSETIVNTSKSTEPTTTAVSTSTINDCDGHANALTMSNRGHSKEQCAMDITPCTSCISPTQGCKSIDGTKHTVQSKTCKYVGRSSTNTIVCSTIDCFRTLGDAITNTHPISLPPSTGGCTLSSPVASLTTSVSVVGFQMPTRCYPYTLSQAVGKGTTWSAPNNSVIGAPITPRPSQTMHPTHHTIPTLRSLPRASHANSVQKPSTTLTPASSSSSFIQTSKLDGQGQCENGNSAQNTRLKPLSLSSVVATETPSSPSSSSMISSSLPTQVKSTSLSKSTSTSLHPSSPSSHSQSSSSDINIPVFSSSAKAETMTQHETLVSFPCKFTLNNSVPEQRDRHPGLTKHEQAEGLVMENKTSLERLTDLNHPMPYSTTPSPFGRNSSPVENKSFTGPPKSFPSNVLAQLTTPMLDSHFSLNAQNSTTWTRSKNTTITHQKILTSSQQNRSPLAPHQSPMSTHEQSTISTKYKHYLPTYQQSNSSINGQIFQGTTHQQHPELTHHQLAVSTHQPSLLSHLSLITAVSVPATVPLMSSDSTIPSKPAVPSPLSTGKHLSSEKETVVIEDDNDDDNDDNEVLILPTCASAHMPGDLPPLSIDVAQPTTNSSLTHEVTGDALSPSEDQDLASFMSSCASMPKSKPFQPELAYVAKRRISVGEDEEIIDEEGGLIIDGLHINDPYTVSYSGKEKDQTVVKCESPTFINEKSSVYTVEDNEKENDDDLIEDDALSDVSSLMSSSSTHNPSKGLPLKDFFTGNPAEKSYSSIAIEALNSKTRQLKEVGGHSRKDSDCEDILKFLMGEDFAVKENTSNRKGVTALNVLKNREVIDLTLENTKHVISISSDEEEEELDNDCEAMVSDYMMLSDTSDIGNHSNQDNESITEEATPDKKVLIEDKFRRVLSASAGPNPQNISPALVQRLRNYALRMSIDKKAELSARIRSIILKKSEQLPEALRPSIMLPDHKQLPPEQMVSAIPEQEIEHNAMPVENEKPTIQAVCVNPVLSETAVPGIPDLDAKKQVITLDDAVCLNPPQEPGLANPGHHIRNYVVPCNPALSMEMNDSVNGLRMPYRHGVVHGNLNMNTAAAPMEAGMLNPTVPKDIGPSPRTIRSSENTRAGQMALNSDPSSVVPIDLASKGEPVYYRTVWQSHVDDSNTSLQSDIVVKPQTINNQATMVQSAIPSKDDSLFQQLKMLKRAGTITSTSTVKDNINGDMTHRLTSTDIRQAMPDGGNGPLNLTKTMISEAGKMSTPIKKEADYENYVQKKVLATQSRSNSVEDKDTIALVTCDTLTTTSTKVQHVVSPFCIRSHDTTEVNEKQKVSPYPSPSQRLSHEVKDQNEKDIKTHEVGEVNTTHPPENRLLGEGHNISDLQHLKAPTLPANYAYIPPWHLQNVALAHPSSLVYPRPQGPNLTLDNRPAKPGTEPSQLVFVRPQPSQVQQSRMPLDPNHILVPLETARKIWSAASRRKSTGSSNPMERPLYKRSDEQQSQRNICSEPLNPDSVASRSHDTSNSDFSHQPPAGEIQTRQHGLDQWHVAFPSYIPIQSEARDRLAPNLPLDSDLITSKGSVHIEHPTSRTAIEGQHLILPSSRHPAPHNSPSGLTHQQYAPPRETNLPLAPLTIRSHISHEPSKSHPPPSYFSVHNHHVHSSQVSSQSYVPPPYRAVPSYTLSQTHALPRLHAQPRLTCVPQTNASSSQAVSFYAHAESAQPDAPPSHSSLPQSSQPQDPKSYSAHPNATLYHALEPRIPQSLDSQPHAGQCHAVSSHANLQRTSPSYNHQPHVPQSHHAQSHNLKSHTSQPSALQSDGFQHHASQSHAPLPHSSQHFTSQTPASPLDNTPRSHTPCQDSLAPSPKRARPDHVQTSRVSLPYALYSYRFPSQSHIRAQSCAIPKSHTSTQNHVPQQPRAELQSHTSLSNAPSNTLIQNHISRQCHVPLQSHAPSPHHAASQSHVPLQSQSHIRPQHHASFRSHAPPEYHAPHLSHASTQSHFLSQASPQFRAPAQFHTSSQFHATSHVAPQSQASHQYHAPQHSHTCPQTHAPFNTSHQSHATPKHHVAQQFPAQHPSHTISPQSNTPSEHHFSRPLHIPPQRHSSPQSHAASECNVLPQSHAPPLNHASFHDHALTKSQTSTPSHLSPRFPAPPSFTPPRVPLSQPHSSQPHVAPPPAHSHTAKSLGHHLHAHSRASFPQPQTNSHPHSSSSSVAHSHNPFTMHPQSQFSRPQAPTPSLHNPHTHPDALSPELVHDLSRKPPIRQDVFPVPPPAHSHTPRAHPITSHAPSTDSLCRNPPQSNGHPKSPTPGTLPPHNLYAASSHHHQVPPQGPGLSQQDSTLPSSNGPVPYSPTFAYHIHPTHTIVPAPANKPARRRPRGKTCRRSSKGERVKSPDEENSTNKKDTEQLSVPEKCDHAEDPERLGPISTADSVTVTLQNSDPQPTDIISSEHATLVHSKVVSVLKNKLKNGHSNSDVLPGDENMKKAQQSRKRKSNQKQKDTEPKRPRRRKVSLKNNLPSFNTTSESSPLVSVSVNNQNAQDSESNAEGSLSFVSKNSSFDGNSNNNSSCKIISSNDIINRRHSMETSLERVESRSDSGFSESGTVPDHTIEEPMSQQFVVKDYEENGIRFVSLQPIADTESVAVTGSDLLEAAMAHEKIYPESDEEIAVNCPPNSIKLEETRNSSLQDSSVKNNTSSYGGRLGGLSSLILASEKLELISPLSSPAPRTDGGEFEVVAEKDIVPCPYEIPGSEYSKIINGDKKIILDKSLKQNPESIPSLVSATSIAGCRGVTEEEEQVASMLVSMVQTLVFKG